MFDEKFSVNVVIFCIIKSDVYESVGDVYFMLGILNIGENCVEGVEFGVSGDVIEKFSI